MLMIGGAAVVAGVSMIPVHAVAWFLKSIRWLPNFVGTLLAAGMLCGVISLLVVVGRGHGAILGGLLALFGFPSLLLTNGIPRKY